MKLINNDLVNLIINNTLPSYQAVSKSDKNLGFGFLFYSIARVLRPEKVVVIGSKAGFSPICYALGIKDNFGSNIKEVQCWDTIIKNKTVGKLYFVDPSFSSLRNDLNNWYGIGFWDDKNKVQKHWKKFGVEKIIKHYKMKSSEFLNHKECPRDVDILFIDGDHSYSGIRHDFNKYYKIMKKDGIILAHDVDPSLKNNDPKTGGFDAINSLNNSKFEVFRLPVFPGLAFVRVIK